MYLHNEYDVYENIDIDMLTLVLDSWLLTCPYQYNGNRILVFLNNYLLLADKCSIKTRFFKPPTHTNIYSAFRKFGNLRVFGHKGPQMCRENIPK